MLSILNTKASNFLIKIFSIITAIFYVTFTLLPDSSSLMVAWSWVFLWQVALLSPILWLLGLIWQQKKLPYLGNYLDWCICLFIIGLIISTIFAEFPNQARWYSWSALGYVAGIYAVNSWVNNPEKRYQLLLKQGYLNIVFICISLILWFSQTYLPELSRINTLKQYGININFDFSVLELRNWAPIGHQNYVAGYLILALPILVGLAILEIGWKRWFWCVGIGLGLLDLYTTSSKGGWLSLIILCIVSFIFILIRSSLPRLWLAIGGITSITILSLLILTNNRLNNVIIAVLSGQGDGELGYRIINNYIGWQMGITHLFTGIGLGGVPILYQKYRPIWAGRESELAYQLHSTPAQIWAEMGIGGILAGLSLIIVLIYLFWRYLYSETKNNQADNHNNYHKIDRIILLSLYGSLLAYIILSITDYQLDNIAISGSLVIFLAIIAAIYQNTFQGNLKNNTFVNNLNLKFINYLVLAGLAITVSVIIWLIPIHRAWQLSNLGFLALNQKNPDINSFVQYLSKSYQLSPWESYYSYQLAWNLGDLALKSSNTEAQQQLITDSINWFEIGIKTSPYQEFGHSNIAWLLLNRNPEAAEKHFKQSAQLVPAKRGIFWGLGLSLLAQNKVDLGIEFMSLEVLRDPIFITSPLWRNPQLQSIYPQVISKTLTKYNDLLNQEPNNTYYHQCRGSLLWWQGDLIAANQDLEKYGTIISKILLQLSQGNNVDVLLNQIPESAAKLIIMAWFNPQQRLQLLEKAWLMATQTQLPEQIKQQLLEGMAKASSFEQWLKQFAPVIQYRRERAGFGVLSRHIDGSLPTDFLTVIENVAISNCFSELFPFIFYEPKFDLVLQEWRNQILTKQR